MKAEFLEYLNSIGITAEEYLKRIETIIEFHSNICQEEIIDIFVDEYIKEDGTRDYDDINFFSNEYDFTARQFLIEDKFVLTKRTKNAIAIIIKKNNYDFKKATENSRLNLEVRYDISKLYAIFKASKENCDHLKQIYFKYLAPNIKN